ncbi:DoxX family protein [Aquimarina sp. U1-2]|uniref:DoxX family protein n=1 Tax=Aquimarina sp. U1-2 TaxID=2823141 RepID=UPI001AEC8BA6|nr:DoxX family protein [Aquimarina sp. U1-2]MBP2830703.1 DoxX family protein [Aquimarina sp. U1-2]
MHFDAIVVFISAISFLFYGISCLFSTRMKNEFIRFGLAKRRTLTGILQLIGGVGLILGYFFSPTLLILSSGGLALLMILGFGVRLKIKDPILAAIPALVYAILNIYICMAYIV